MFAQNDSLRLALAPGLRSRRMAALRLLKDHASAVQFPGYVGTSALLRITDSRWTSRHVRKVPTTEVQVGLLATCFLASG
jgi:hypothetical protein